MDGTDKDLGWEDVGTGGRGVAGRSAPGAAAQEGNISDAVTSAMMNQFARELTSSLATKSLKTVFTCLYHAVCQVL